MRVLLFGLLLLVALPEAAGAAGVRVEPYREPPSLGGGCAKYQTCPEEMLVFAAASGEANDVSIASSFGGGPRIRLFVFDVGSTPVQAGPGCERIDARAAVCIAGAVGPVELGDLGDRITTPGGGLNAASGGDGDDVLNVTGTGVADGGAGDDVVIARSGSGGAGDDVMSVVTGQGGTGDDLLRCFPDVAFCALGGGSGNDRLIGGGGGGQQDRLFGAGGRDVLDGRAGNDVLEGGPGDDRLRGGGGEDRLRGDAGADRLDARERRSSGERTARDRVNCGSGRRDRAIVDRSDRVARCERVARARRQTR